jgi:hypothetical protein
MTPGWLYEEGVPKYTFIINLPPKANNCHPATVPAYWDQRYADAYSRMIQALAAHLHAVPDWYNAVRIVKIDGINLNTEETYIPSQEPLSPGSKQLAVHVANCRLSTKQNHPCMDSAGTGGGASVPGQALSDGYSSDWRGFPAH